MIYNILAFGDVMKSIGGIVLAVVILLAMVTIHEFGHYITGKLLGFKINEFSVGFGPAILKKRSKKTGELFSLRVIPLGGYCAFDGEDELEEEEELDKESENEAPMVEVTNEKEEEYPEPKGERFNDQPPWKRIIVLVAGATMNYLLALLLIITMFAGFGRPVYQVVKSAPPEENPHISAIETYESGLQTGDIVLKIEGETMYLITDYMDVLDGKKQGDVVEVLVERNGEKVTVELPLVWDADVKNMSDTNTVIFALGLASKAELPDKETGELKMQLTRGGGFSGVTLREGFFETIGNTFAYSFKIGGTILRSLGELLTGKLGMEAVGGPITTIKVTAEAASDGVLSFLNIAALIGVNLAVFNLLPVPALDGCKVIFCAIEWIRKKPLNRKVETIINLIGMVILFGFAILVDLLKLF